MLTPEQLAEIPEYHIPAIWHDSHWDNCDATNPDAHCRRCETFWPCDAARLLEHIKAMEERYSVERIAEALENTMAAHSGEPHLGPCAWCRDRAATLHLELRKSRQ